MLLELVPTWQAGMERLTAFAPKAGRAYASGRNTDTGNPNRQAVSMLSPYIRRRMITELEVIAETLRHHSPETADKFIQEVVWRTYWKGWLEMRPAIWERYLTMRQRDLDDLARNDALRRDYEAATLGQTGIDGFDQWARELTSTGYLHNHARMWFASIWIFTLRLPWALGADFFYRHLIDADPASNTLSWRWVAGLHTKGKTYLARPDNIDKHTEGRFRPSGLAPFAEPLIEAETVPDPLPPRQAESQVPQGRYALLLTSDDLSPQSWPGFTEHPPALILSGGQVPQEAALNDGRVAAAFTRDAVANTARDLAEETGAVHEPIHEMHVNAITRVCTTFDVHKIALPFAQRGPTMTFRDELAGAAKETPEGAHCALHEVQRTWDAHAFPHATAGFFKMKTKIPSLLAKAGLTRR